MVAIDMTLSALVTV